MASVTKPRPIEGREPAAEHRDMRDRLFTQINLEAVAERTEIRELGLAEVAATVRFVAREWPSAVEAVLWAVCHSANLVESCSAPQPSAHAYAELASLARADSSLRAEGWWRRRWGSLA
jgi:hypothetical protein